jgi:cell division septation protein DedD
MEQKQRLFIYDRREVSILVFLGLMVAAFAFTLGVHLGKKVTAHPLTPVTAEVPQTATLQDNLPNKQELTEQARTAQAAADEELSHSLHEEVQKTGIKLKTPRQVDLPSETKSGAGGATTLKVAAAVPVAVSPKKAIQEINKAAQEIAPAIESPAQGKEASQESAGDEASASAHGKYTLQIGSFPSAEEAKSKMDELRAQGLRPFVRSAQVKGLGKRFRLFVGDFLSRDDAEKAGKKYQSERMIESYLVSRSGE